MNQNLSRRGFLAAGAIAPSLMAAPGAPPPAPIRTLGRTGLKVTSVGFGCMVTSDSSVIERAVDQGITYFDTARVYSGGNNERMVGAALKPHRQKLVISSKTVARDKEGALRDIDTTLRELQTDHVDIWFLHAKDRPEQITPDLLEAQQIAKKAGKIRFAGVSTHFNMDRVLPHLVKLGQTDVALTTYNFAMRSVASGSNTDTAAPKTDMTAVIREARKAGMGIVVMKTLAGGTTRVQRGDRLYGADPRALARQLSQPGVPLAAIKWALRNEAVDTAIVCMTDHDQLSENLLAMAGPFTNRDEKLLEEHLARISPTYCRMCGTCTGICANGVPVPDVLRILTYAEGYGQFAMARERYLELPEPARAVRCTDCSECSVKCPNGVRVQERVTRAQEWFG